MTTMMAALHDGKETMRVHEVPRPVPGPGDVLVRVRRVGICGSDLHNYAVNTTPETFSGGHELAGEIVEVGEGVAADRVGERVAVDVFGHARACLTCWYCRIGQFRHCIDRTPEAPAGFAPYLSRRAYGCYPLPDGVSWEEGGLVEPLAVSVHGVRRARMAAGETVAVLGAGTIGLTSVAAARALGAGKVFVTARHPHQAEMAKHLGADEALPPEGPSLWEALAEVTEGRGADLSIETVGGTNSEVLKQAIEVTRPQGRIAVLGGFWAPLTLDWFDPQQKEQSVIFSRMYSVMDGRHDFEIAIDLMASGRVALKPMVTHQFPLEEIQGGFETAGQKSAGSIKVQIQM